MRSLTVVLVLLTTLTFGQVDDKVIKEQAERTAKALMNDDYETLVKFTYPKVIELVGGRDKMISLIKKGKAEMEQQGISFSSVTIGSPLDKMIAGDEIHCLISQTILLKVPKGKMKSESYLLAISKDNGTTWYFIDTVSLNKDNIKSVLPNYNVDLVIPERQQPVFIPD